jgi:hypothetical protein
MDSPKFIVTPHDKATDAAVRDLQSQGELLEYSIEKTYGWRICRALEETGWNKTLVILRRFPFRMPMDNTIVTILPLCNTLCCRCAILYEYDKIEE